MTFLCKDCSYRGITSGQAGECPACGSFDLARASRKEDEKPPGKWRLVVLGALWAYLIALIIWKLNS